MIKNNNFETVRKRLKLTNRDFSKLIGIGETAYSKLKKGLLPVGEQTIIKIEEAFPEYNIEWLLHGVEPESSKYKPAQEKNITNPNINEQNDLMSKIEDLTEQLNELKQDKKMLMQDKQRLHQDKEELKAEIARLRSQLGDTQSKEKTA